MPSSKALERLPKTVRRTAPRVAARPAPLALLVALLLAAPLRPAGATPAPAQGGATDDGPAAPAAGPGDASGPRLVDSERPYVLQWMGLGTDAQPGRGVPSRATAEYEVGYGTRDTRFVGSQGIEQRLRLRLRPHRIVSVEATGGLLLGPEGAPDGRAHGSGGLTVGVRALSQRRLGVDLDLGVGYLYDYRGRHVARFHETAGRSFGRLDLRLGSSQEVPLSGEGDEVDLLVGFAASYRVAPWFRQGVELAVEDLEGFWEADEAEGGARLVFGPTAYFSLPSGLEVRVNGSAVYAPTRNPVGEGASLPPRWGLLCRLSLGYSFW